jgi:hypothetical protein
MQSPRFSRLHFNRIPPVGIARFALRLRGNCSERMHKARESRGYPSIQVALLTDTARRACPTRWHCDCAQFILC